MVVVSDTSPISNLFRIGRLGLLRLVYDKVVVPEAITLAIELQADYLLIDERLGRAVAESAGIRVVGLLGTLREAKQLGIIPEIKPILDEMRTVARFRISETLYRLILSEAGEADK